MHQLTYHIHKHAQHTLTISQHSHWHTHWFAACTLWLFLSHMNTYTQMHSLSLSLFHAHTYTHTHTHTVTQHHACQRVIACLHDLELWTLLIPMVGCIADVLFSYCNEFAFASISWWQFLGEVIKGSRYYKDTWSSHSLGVRLATENCDWHAQVLDQNIYMQLYTYTHLFSPPVAHRARIYKHTHSDDTLVYTTMPTHTHTHVHALCTYMCELLADMQVSIQQQVLASIQIMLLHPALQLQFLSSIVMYGDVVDICIHMRSKTDRRECHKSIKPITV